MPNLYPLSRIASEKFDARLPIVGMKWHMRLQPPTFTDPYSSVYISSFVHIAEPEEIAAKNPSEYAIDPERTWVEVGIRWMPQVDPDGNVIPNRTLGLPYAFAQDPMGGVESTFLAESYALLPEGSEGRDTEFSIIRDQGTNVWRCKAGGVDLGTFQRPFTKPDWPQGYPPVDGYPPYQHNAVDNFLRPRLNRARHFTVGVAIDSTSDTHGLVTLPYTRMADLSVAFEINNSSSYAFIWRRIAACESGYCAEGNQFSYENAEPIVARPSPPSDYEFQTGPFNKLIKPTATIPPPIPRPPGAPTPTPPPGGECDPPVDIPPVIPEEEPSVPPLIPPN